MQFIKDEQMELDLNVDESVLASPFYENDTKFEFDRETLKEKYDGALKAHYDDPAFEVVSILFRVLADKKVTTPGNYQSSVLGFLLITRLMY